MAEAYFIRKLIRISVNNSSRFYLYITFLSGQCFFPGSAICNSRNGETRKWKGSQEMKCQILIAGDGPQQIKCHILLDEIEK